MMIQTATPDQPWCWTTESQGDRWFRKPMAAAISIW